MDRQRSEIEVSTPVPSRRDVLRGAGGLAALSMIANPSQAEPTGNSVHLVEIGLKTKEEFVNGCELPIPSHAVRRNNLYVPEFNQYDWSNVETEDMVVYSYHLDKKYLMNPKTIFKGNSRKDVSTSLNTGLLPSGILSLAKQIAFPTIQVETDSDNSIRFSSGRDGVTVKPGEEKELDLGSQQAERPPKSKGGSNRPVTLSTVATIRNNGVLNVHSAPSRTDSPQPPQ